MLSLWPTPYASLACDMTSASEVAVCDLRRSTSVICFMPLPYNIHSTGKLGGKAYSKQLPQTLHANSSTALKSGPLWMMLEKLLPPPVRLIVVGKRADPWQGRSYIPGGSCLVFFLRGG